MPARETPEINFADKDELSTRSGGKFVQWGLTYGKVVIVITELVVISLWLSRFWLDNSIANLNEGITRKKDVIISSEEFESKFRSFTSRVSTAKVILNALSADTVLAETKKLLPEGTAINSLVVNGSKVSLEGISQNEESLGFLSRSFKESSGFSNVDFKKVSKDNQNVEEAGDISFSLSADYIGKEDVK